MKKSLAILLVGLLCFSMLTILAPASVSATPITRFRLLAVERWFDHTNMNEGHDLISELLNYQNWNNATASYVSNIHLLTMLSQADLPANVQPCYAGLPTKANLECEIKNFLGQAGDEEIVILYYCGHGGDRFWQLDEDVLDTELIPWLGWGGLPDAYVTVIMDTCHSGSWINDGADPGVMGSNRDVLAACKSTQLAYCWGCHTAFTDEGLIPGFGSATDANGDGWISAKEVFNYAQPHCIAYAVSQGATEEPVSWYDLCTGNLPLVQRDTTKVFPDFAYPKTKITIGTPKHKSGSDIYVTSATAFTLDAQDVACPTTGVDYTEFRIDAGSWGIYTIPFSLSLALGDGWHTIYYRSSDNAGNLEPQKSQAVFLDNTPPSTLLSIGNPKYTSGLDTYVTSSTVFTLTPTDSGSGVAHTHYKVGAGPWTEGTSFTIVGPDGPYTYQWKSKDYLDNIESTHSGSVILDNTPPTTTLTIGIPQYTDAYGNVYVASWTPFSLSATDGGSGVKAIAYRIHNAVDSGWLPYSVPFTFAGYVEGNYTVEYNSTDNLGNVEVTNAKLVILDSKMAIAGWSKTEIQKLKDEVAASGVNPGFKLVGNMYLQMALGEMDEALGDIGRGWNTQANAHLYNARYYVNRFFTLTSSFSGLINNPALAAQWRQEALQIVADINTAINTPV